jgi:hypothetical protein
MGFFRNIKESIDDKSPISVNNITVLASALMGVIIGFVICFVLVYDVTYDGKVDTNLTDLGIFLLCSGGYILGSGVPKAYIEGKMKSRSWVEGEKMQIDADEEIRAYRKQKMSKFEDADKDEEV